MLTWAYRCRLEYLAYIIKERTQNHIIWEPGRCPAFTYLSVMGRVCCSSKLQNGGLQNESCDLCTGGK